MKRISRITTLALGLTLAAAGAQAACIVEYKAKRDNPLELFYGTAQVGGDCSTADASARLQKKLAKDGLTLLKVLSIRKE
ncbi:hypothetical protein [Marimonas lutisalis]|uniref:hypothetical protein n=1 Tax=Marimonas lutisalis TaxID=2545756 RepID=UPI0010F70E6F|nr:hypothetical protein [Marimonas lutisalis]